MKEETCLSFCLLLSILSLIHCQTTNVRSNLRQCYNESAIPGVTSANNRPPATLNVLVELIRRIEDANPFVTPRALSALIIQRLRQDGIMGTARQTDLRYGIPFSPTRLESYKGTLISERYLTNISQELNYGDLSPIEICTLHYLISSTIQNRVRGDEATTCTRSARYTLRISREAEQTEGENTPEGAPQAGQSDVESVEGIEGFGTRSLSSGNNEISQCPIELGVVLTNYGTVKAGQMLIGLATGFNKETVDKCDNRYASTIAGELCEAALVQASETIELGAQGGWNSTLNPKHYFLQKNRHLQVTDAEIRGSLDGLYMGLQLDSWKSKYSDLKISQILEMYYAREQKGVFDSSFKACNRSLLFNQITTIEKLVSETTCLMTPLDDHSQYKQTVDPEAYPELANNTVNSFLKYLSGMNTSDLACKPVDSNIERTATDLLIFVGSNWKYNTLQPILTYLIHNLDVNKFGSKYSIFDAGTGRTITNSTQHLLDLHKTYNLTVHQSLSTNFDYQKVFEIIESVAKSKLNNNIYAGGESTVALLVPGGPPDENQRSFLEQKREFIKLFLPDISIIVLSTGLSGSYDSILVNSNKDFITLVDSTIENDLKIIAGNVADRIKDAPRAIVNPSCGSELKGITNSFSLTEYVEPKGVNYYRISPQYFFTGDETGRNLKITENSFGSIDVCISREQSKPNNQTSECETLKSNVKTIDISGYCSGSTVAECSPIYLAVYGNSSDYKCKGAPCRFLDNIEYTISLENVGCASGTVRNLINFGLVAIIFLLQKF